jgi:hypothetical protein
VTGTPAGTGVLVRRKLEFESHFTQVPNEWVRDKRISRKARGILVELLSHSDGYEVSIKSLAEGEIDGIASIRSGVEELEQAGYLERDTIRKGGRFGVRWVIKDPRLDPLPLFDEPVDSRVRKSHAAPVDSRSTAFENRTPTAFENRTTKRTPSRTPIKSSQGDHRGPTCSKGHDLIDERHCTHGCPIEVAS